MGNLGKEIHHQLFTIKEGKQNRASENVSPLFL
jgi:hypothetical protein